MKAMSTHSSARSNSCQPEDDTTNVDTTIVEVATIDEEVKTKKCRSEVWDHVVDLEFRWIPLDSFFLHGQARRYKSSLLTSFFFVGQARRYKSSLLTSQEVKPEAVSWSPRIILFHSFLSTEVMDEAFSSKNQEKSALSL